MRVNFMIRGVSLVIIYLTFVHATVFAADTKEYTFIHGKTELKNPYDVRDPFKRRIPEKKSLARAKERSKGIYNNSTESIDTSHVENIQIVGIMIGKERRALAKAINGKDTFILKEGMKIGTDGAEVKVILPGGVVLAEKIKNVYDQEEYIETVLPISGN
jgi:type IV pilus assembly protein PilP